MNSSEVMDTLNTIATYARERQDSIAGRYSTAIRKGYDDAIEEHIQKFISELSPEGASGPQLKRTEDILRELIESALGYTDLIPGLFPIFNMLCGDERGGGSQPWRARVDWRLQSTWLEEVKRDAANEREQEIMQTQWRKK